MNRRKGHKKIADAFLATTVNLYVRYSFIILSVKLSLETSPKIKLKLPIFSKIAQDGQFSFFFFFFQLC